MKTKYLVISILIAAFAIVLAIFLLNSGTNKISGKALASPGDWCDGADLDRDGDVDDSDVDLLSGNFDRRDCFNGNNWCDNSDIDNDGNVSDYDNDVLSGNYGRTDCVETQIPSCNKICTKVLNVSELINMSQGFTNDRVAFRDLKSGVGYNAVIYWEGLGSVNIGGKTYNLTYGGAHVRLYNSTFEQKAFKWNNIVMSPSGNGQINCNEMCVDVLRVNQIINQTVGYNNDRVNFLNMKTADLYETTITQEGKGSVRIGRIGYGVEYFGNISYGQSYVRLNASGLLDAKAFYNGYIATTLMM